MAAPRQGEYVLAAQSVNGTVRAHAMLPQGALYHRRQEPLSAALPQPLALPLEEGRLSAIRPRIAQEAILGSGRNPPSHFVTVLRCMPKSLATSP